MKKPDRYDVTHLAENQFQPGSRGRILKNLLAITSKREMDIVEGKEYLQTIGDAAGLYSRGHRFLSKDVRDIHRLWLKDIYEWAGEYRQVNISKGGFPFAASAYIPELMHKFEEGPLKIYTPCLPGPEMEVAEALAIVHAELILIHPFRDGNGRLARLLAFLMALQADLPSLDFGEIGMRDNSQYIEAIHSAMDRNYQPLKEIFISILRSTLNQA